MNQYTLVENNCWKSLLQEGDTASYIYSFQQLSLDVHGSSESSAGTPAVSNLDVLFTKFQEIIKNELEKTDMVSFGLLYFLFDLKYS